MASSRHRGCGIPGQGRAVRPRRSGRRRSLLRRRGRFISTPASYAKRERQWSVSAYARIHQRTSKPAPHSAPPPPPSDAQVASHARSVHRHFSMAIDRQLRRRLTVVALSEAGRINAILRDRPDGFRHWREVEDVAREAGIYGVFSAEGNDWRRNANSPSPRSTPTTGTATSRSSGSPRSGCTA